MYSGITFRSLLLSVALHVVFGALLLLNIELFPRALVPPVQHVKIVRAVKVDDRQVEAELKRLQDIDKQKEAEQKKKEQELAARLEELRKKTDEAERKRKAEEKRLADLEQKKKQEQKEREDLDRKRRQDEEQKKQAEEEKKRKEAEEAMKKQVAEEEQRLNEQRLRDEQNVISEYSERIRDAIRQEFNTTGLPDGLYCVLQIRMIPGGEVVEVRIAKSSGNAVFDRRAEVAVGKAAPLPVPGDARLFEKMRELRLTFAPES